MKRKIILCLIILLSVFLVTGCGNNNVSSKSNNESNSNAVVLYFSATGTTKTIAKRIANESNSDIIEIIPKDEYKKGI